MLELIIGDFEEKRESESCPGWKFILTREADSIILYAKTLGGHYKDSHRNVACLNKVESEEILGGGEIYLSGSTLGIRGMSGDFGIVPNSIMEKFAKPIGEELETEYEIKKIEIDMWYDSGISEKKSPQHIEMWNKLGYEFDNQKRDIEI